MKLFKNTFSVLLTAMVLLSCSQKMEESIEEPDKNTRAIPMMPKKKFQTYTVGNRNVKVLLVDGDNLWIGTSQGLLNYDKATYNSFKAYTYDNGLLSNGIFSITIDKDGKKWVGTYGGGLSVFDGKIWKNYNVPDGLCDSFVYDVLFENDDTMWIATWSGANRVRGDITKRTNWETFTVENTNNELGDDWVYALDKDRSGVMWLGTEVGISRFDGKSWEKWDHKNGMGASFEVVNDDNAVMNAALAGSHHAGQQRQVGLLQRNVGNYNPNYVVSMIMDRNDNLWLGTWGGGLSRFDINKREFKNYTVKDGLPGNYIISLAESPDGNLWIGSNEGLSKFDGKRFTNYTTKDGLFNNYVFSIEFDIDNTLWVGGWGGFSHIFELPG